jgi:hypothetical protein
MDGLLDFLLILVLKLILTCSFASNSAHAGGMAHVDGYMYVLVLFQPEKLCR